MGHPDLFQIGHYERVARTVKLGEWGALTVYDRDEQPPRGLHGTDDYWLGDARRLPVEVQTKVGVVPYVAVWPNDLPPPGDGPLTEAELDGVALTTPVSHHRCFVCGATVAGLYVDTGADFFGLRSHAYDWLQACPSCDTTASVARLTGILPMPTAKSA